MIGKTFDSLREIQSFFFFAWQFKYFTLLFVKTHDFGYPSQQIEASISRFESMSFIANILACKLKIVNNRN